MVPEGDAFVGSSPRVRGAEKAGSHIRVDWRIIPARAGSRDDRQHQETPAEDHPRACGEQLERDVLVIEVEGSSPRVRGADLKIPAKNTLSL